MTIHEIKAKVEATGSHFFERETMKFFNQRLRDFSVTKYQHNGINGNLIEAPIYDREGHHVGLTRKFYNPETYKLESI